MRLEESIVVRAPPRDAFLIGGHPERMPLWNPSVLESRILGELEEGATVVQVARVLGHRFETVYRVTRYEPYRCITCSSISGPMDIEGTMAFREEGSGTSLLWSVVGDVRGFFQTAECLLRATGRLEMRRCLERLKALLERERTPAAEAIAGARSS